MFGYLVAATELLEEQQQRRYKALYCGLCRSLGENFGQSARLCLSYDLCFLLMLLSSLYEPQELEGKNRCPRHPFKEQDWASGEFSAYAANMTVALSYLKCLDDWQDEHKLSARAMAAALRGDYERVKLAYPRQCEAMKKALAELSEIEGQLLPAPDAAADCFGRLMEEIFVYKEDRWSDTLRAMAHALGRFLYFMDAAMDIDKDKLTGSYNPFSDFAGCGDNEGHFRDILKMTLGECVFYFDKLPLVQDAALMQNILCVGLWLQFNGKYSRKDS